MRTVVWAAAVAALVAIGAWQRSRFKVAWEGGWGGCQTTFVWERWEEVEVPRDACDGYALYRHVHGAAWADGTPDGGDAAPSGGTEGVSRGEGGGAGYRAATPVLFVHGHRGSYRQARCLAAAVEREEAKRRATAATRGGEATGARHPPRLETYSLSLASGSSALHSRIARRQVLCVAAVLRALAGGSSPRSPLVVAHSTGARVARDAAAEAGERGEVAVPLLVSLAAPTRAWPGWEPTEPRWWRRARGRPGSLVPGPPGARRPRGLAAELSVSAGPGDLLVPGGAAGALRASPGDVLTTSLPRVPGARATANHPGVLSCDQLLSGVAAVLLSAAAADPPGGSAAAASPRPVPRDLALASESAPLGSRLASRLLGASVRGGSGGRPASAHVVEAAGRAGAAAWTREWTASDPELGGAAALFVLVAGARLGLPAGASLSPLAGSPSSAPARDPPASRDLLPPLLPGLIGSRDRAWAEVVAGVEWAENDTSVLVLPLSPGHGALLSVARPPRGAGPALVLVQPLGGTRDSGAWGGESGESAASGGGEVRGGDGILAGPGQGGGGRGDRWPVGPGTPPGPARPAASIVFAAPPSPGTLPSPSLCARLTSALPERAWGGGPPVALTARYGRCEGGRPVIAPLLVASDRSGLDAPASVHSTSSSYLPLWDHQAQTVVLLADPGCPVMVAASCQPLPWLRHALPATLPALPAAAASMLLARGRGGAAAAAAVAVAAASVAASSDDPASGAPLGAAPAAALYVLAAAAVAAAAPRPRPLRTPPAALPPLSRASRSAVLVLLASVIIHPGLVLPGALAFAVWRHGGQPDPFADAAMPVALVAAARAATAPRAPIAWLDAASHCAVGAGALLGAGRAAAGATRLAAASLLAAAVGGGAHGLAAPALAVGMASALALRAHLPSLPGPQAPA